MLQPLSRPTTRPLAACRVWMVEVERGKATALITSCNTEIADGMVIRTDSESIEDPKDGFRPDPFQTTSHGIVLPGECGSCTLQDLAYKYGVRESRFFEETDGVYTRGRKSCHSTRYRSKCITCAAAVSVFVLEHSRSYAIDFKNRGFETQTGTPFGKPLSDTTCVLCGQCVSTCPVGSLVEKQAVGMGREWDLNRSKPPVPHCGARLYDVFKR